MCNIDFRPFGPAYNLDSSLRWNDGGGDAALGGFLSVFICVHPWLKNFRRQPAAASPAALRPAIRPKITHLPSEEPVM